MDTGSRPLTSVIRAFEILDLLWQRNGAGPSEVAGRLDIPNSTAHDYLRSLASTKYVINDNGTYSLSSYFMTVGGKMRYRNQLFQVAKHEMKRVAADTNELVGLTIEAEGMAIILHQEEGGRALNLGTYPGASTPLHTNASGKAILSFLPEDRRAEILSSRGLVARTEHTITDRERLSAELDTIREREEAIDWDEQVVGMGMAAVPLLAGGNILGSICIVTPTGRMKDEEYQQDLLQKLHEIKHTIEINYQYGQ